MSTCVYLRLLPAVCCLGASSPSGLRFVALHITRNGEFTCSCGGYACVVHVQAYVCMHACACACACVCVCVCVCGVCVYVCVYIHMTTYT